jgi:hypothetical protein
MGSAHFLTSYGESLHVTCQGPQMGVDGKGKAAVPPGVQWGKAWPERGRSNMKTLVRWEPPPPGWVKAKCRRRVLPQLWTS